MTRSSSSRHSVRKLANPRHGTVVVLTALLLVFILGLAALAVDVGYLHMGRTQLQTAADSGALAGASSLIDGTVFDGTPSAPNSNFGSSAARSSAVSYAQSNRVCDAFPAVSPNNTNDPNGDVVLGYLSDPSNRSQKLDTSNPALFNACQVTVQRTASENGLVKTFFGRVLGYNGVPELARATAVVSSSVSGFQATAESGNPMVLPFAMEQTKWEIFMANDGRCGCTDGLKFQQSNHGIYSGTDGLREMRLYPLSNGASGNFGTVDIGGANNSTADLERQILHGISAADMQALGKPLKLGLDGTMTLNGDTGISAAVKDELLAIRGQPRAIPLYSKVTGNGNNATYTIVGFVGVRVMDVNLTGTPKYVKVQPAGVMDRTAIISTVPNQSQFIFSDPRLVR